MDEKKRRHIVINVLSSMTNNLCTNSKTVSKSNTLLFFLAMFSSTLNSKYI